jgi:hypothetical protein
MQSETDVPVRLAPEPPRAVSRDRVSELPGKGKRNPVSEQIIRQYEQFRPGTRRDSAFLENRPDFIPFLEPFRPAEPKRNTGLRRKIRHFFLLFPFFLVRLLFVRNRQFNPPLRPAAFQH